MTGITATEARSNLYRLIGETTESHQPIVIMGKRNRTRYAGAYSRRINIQHRLVYQVLDDERVVKVLRLWSYYE
jgi:Txe/YoeB family toxin of toxin-antitoxin system